MDGNPPKCSNCKKKANVTKTSDIPSGNSTTNTTPLEEVIKCETYGSTDHTKEEHPKSGICNSAEHVTDNHPICDTCRSVEHTTSNHPVCSICGSANHTTEKRSECSKCGGCIGGNCECIDDA